MTQLRRYVTLPFVALQLVRWSVVAPPLRPLGTSVGGALVGPLTGKRRLAAGEARLSPWEGVPHFASGHLRRVEASLNGGLKRLSFDLPY